MAPTSATKQALPDIYHVEDQTVCCNPCGLEEKLDIDNGISTYSEEEQRAIIRKVDVRLIPICGLMFCVSLIDRTNIGNASIAGMTAELKLVKIHGVDRYSIVNLVFFITYVIFQSPATIACRKMGPRVFLASICLIWGCVMIGFGFVNDWKDLVGLRIALGALEAGFFPGVVYLMSTWYKRYEIGQRYAAFYLISTVAAAFGGILAYGLMQMDGLAGYRGWRWIFIIEGILTCIIAVLGYFFLMSFPDDTGSKSLQFLTPAEKKCVIDRVNADRGDAELAQFNFKKWVISGTDWKIWAYAVIFGCNATVGYGLAFFLPIILHLELKFDIGTSQCLVAPPYLLAGIVMFFMGWWGDRYKMRGPTLVLNAVLAATGLAIVGFHNDAAVQYFGVFLATVGANSNVPVVMAYQANNIRGQWKRAFCSATLVGAGAIGGILGSTVFRSQDSPKYTLGICVAIGCQLMIVVIVAILTIDFRRQNAIADRGQKVLEEGDASFRYTY